MDPVTGSLIGALGSAGISSASGLLGMFGQRGPSERDLMWEQAKIARSNFQFTSQSAYEYARKMARNSASDQVLGLKKAGLNPMMALSKGVSAPQAVSGQTGSTSIAAPVNRYEPLVKGIQFGMSSALEVARTMADIRKKEAETETEKVRPGSVLAQTARDYAAATQSSALTAHEQQKMGRTMIQMAIDKENLTVAEKEAIIAAIDVDLYSSTVGEVARMLQQLGFAIGPAKAAAGALLKLFGVGSRGGK